jgi:hypothetical protein
MVSWSPFLFVAISASMDFLRETRVQDVEGNTVCAQCWTDGDFVYLSAPDGEETMLPETIMGQ